MNINRFGVTRQAMMLRPFQVTLVPVAHVLVGLGQFIMKYAIVFFVHLPLIRVGFALHEFLTALAAPAGEKADTGTRFGFVIGDEVRIVTILTLPCSLTNAGNFKRRPEFDQYFLKRFAFAGRWYDGDAHRINRTVVFGNRSIQHRHYIVTFQISGIR